MFTCWLCLDHVCQLPPVWSGAVYACACQLRVEGVFWLPSVASGSASVFACWLRPDHVCQLPPVGSGAVYACACRLRVEGVFWQPSVASGSASVLACLGCLLWRLGQPLCSLVGCVSITSVSCLLWGLELSTLAHGGCELKACFGCLLWRLGQPLCCRQASGIRHAAVHRLSANRR